MTSSIEEPVTEIIFFFHNPKIAEFNNETTKFLVLKKCASECLIFTLKIDLWRWFIFCLIRAYAGLLGAMVDTLQTTDSAPWFYELFSNSGEHFHYGQSFEITIACFRSWKSSQCNTSLLTVAYGWHVFRISDFVLNVFDGMFQLFHQLAWFNWTEFVKNGSNFPPLLLLTVSLTSQGYLV